MANGKWGSRPYQTITPSWVPTSLFLTIIASGMMLTRRETLILPFDSLSYGPLFSGGAAILAAFSGVPPGNVEMTSEAQPRRKNIKSAPQDAERSRQDADAPHRSVDTTNRA